MFKVVLIIDILTVTDCLCSKSNIIILALSPASHVASPHVGTELSARGGQSSTIAFYPTGKVGRPANGTGLGRYKSIRLPLSTAAVCLRC